VVKRPHSLVGLLMGLMIPFSVFQDTAMQHSPLGIAVASPVFFLLALVWILRLSGNPVHGLIHTRINRWVVIVVLGYVMLNIYYGLQFGSVAYGENLFVKGTKIGLLLASIVYAGWLFSNYTISSFKNWIMVGAFIAFGGLVLDFLIHDTLVRSWWLHYGINDQRFQLIGFDDRPRGFSYESSTLGITLLVFGVLSALSVRRGWPCLAWLIGTGIALLFCGSKSAFLVFAFSLATSALLTKSRWVFVTFLVAGPMLLMMAFITVDQWWPIVDQKFILPFMLDIDETTSVATRLTMAVSAVLSVVQNPFGVGFSGYMPALVANIENAGDLGSRLLGLPLNLNEVKKYLVQETSFAIGAKSFFFDNAVVFGMPFVLLWVVGHIILIKRYRNSKDAVSLTLLLGMFIPLTFYSSGVSIYILPVAYGYLIQCSRSQLDKKKFLV
jgi:hypothetical protein